MTLPLNSRLSALYDTNGTQKDFSFGFRVFFDPDNGGYGLEVRRQTAGGYEVIPKSDYLVLPVEDNSAGVVRFNVAPSAGQQIYIAGKTPTIQQLVLTNFGRYSAESIETQLDYITAIIQEWLSALGEEERQRIANDLIVVENANEVFLEWKGWAESNVPTLVNESFNESFADFRNIWTEAINQITISSLPALSVPTLNSQNQQQINDYSGADWYSKPGGYALNDRVRLSNGDLVISTIANNTNNPNVNMDGWSLWLSASRVKLSNGDSVQDFFDEQELHNAKFVTPEMFGAVANSWETDNTAALNAAFATGKDVYSTPDKVYTCNGNLRTQGQRCVGGWKIRSSKAVVGGSWLNVANTYAVPCDFTYLQGVYCAYAYDLAELFAIRDLGYNTLLHYGGMHINGYDMDGTVQNLLDNAKTAGLQVFLGTQNSLNGMTLTDFVNTHKNHPAVLGFLIADEPTHNSIPVSQQQSKIDLMHTLTNKPLAVSDFTFDAFTEVLADGYDYIFGNIYNDLGATQQQTLYKMRAWLGLTSKRHQNSRVLPAVMGFKYGAGASLIDIIETSKIYAKACGGNFSCFVWDGLGDPGISNSIRDTAALQVFSKEICAYKTNVYQIPECYTWGGVNNITYQEDYGLPDVIKHFVRVDPNFSTGFEGVNCYPALMLGGAVESDRVTTHLSAGQAISGIWFKGTYGAYVSDIKMNRYNHITVQSGMLDRGGASVELGVRGSQTGGYGVGAVLATLPIDLSVATETFENPDLRDMFCIKYDSSLNAPYYRTFVRGVYITSDW